MAGAPLAARYLQWEPGMANWAVIYSLVILATANGTPNDGFSVVSPSASPASQRFGCSTAS